MPLPQAVSSTVKAVVRATLKDFSRHSRAGGNPGFSGFCCPPLARFILQGPQIKWGLYGLPVGIMGYKKQTWDLWVVSDPHCPHCRSNINKPLSPQF